MRRATEGSLDGQVEGFRDEATASAYRNTSTRFTSVDIPDSTRSSILTPAVKHRILRSSPVSGQSALWGGSWRRKEKNMESVQEGIVGDCHFCGSLAFALGINRGL